MPFLVLLILASAPEPPECHKATVYFETRSEWYLTELRCSRDTSLYFEAAGALVPLLRTLVDGRCPAAQKAADVYRDIMRLPDAHQ